MLWHKSWLETRWRFVIGMVIAALSAVGVVLTYPRLKELLPMLSPAEVQGPLAGKIREALALSRDYHGYVWSQWFAKQLIAPWTLFAVLLGAGGLVAQSTRGGALFTLSLPVPRWKLVAIRAATGLAELAVLSVASTGVLLAMSPAIGEQYPVGEALVHAGFLAVAGSVFFSLATLLSTVFSDIWRPLGIALFAAVVLALAEQLVPAMSRFSVFQVMSAERAFRGDGWPWLGLVISAAASAGMLYAAARNIARQDF